MQIVGQPVAIATARIGYFSEQENLMNSREVAEFFGKNHRDVLRAIDNLLKKAPDLRGHFEPRFYTVYESGNQQYRCFEIDDEGREFLVMGFTGKPALKSKQRLKASQVSRGTNVDAEG